MSRSARLYPWRPHGRAAQRVGDMPHRRPDAGEILPRAALRPVDVEARVAAQSHPPIWDVAAHAEETKRGVGERRGAKQRADLRGDVTVRVVFKVLPNGAADDSCRAPQHLGDLKCQLSRRASADGNKPLPAALSGAAALAESPGQSPL
jgi:hypothetical protein